MLQKGDRFVKASFGLSNGSQRLNEQQKVNASGCIPGCRAWQFSDNKMPIGDAYPIGILQEKCLRTGESVCNAGDATAGQNPHAFTRAKYFIGCLRNGSELAVV